ncbi:MAG: hypothetical protein A2X05_15495 [Bacteroidetes bacterium GWE2_41_25]|nr:MAG: hypothetical protein A2X03_07430 [Bacteroidetes bacterium GWA2_40_15]OFX90039.1 MAG: hypothetical protein A2X06_18140 [Bacteroidetes bacterium GWC2_40_22]OFY08197.1 MAG: hypothetical protein A2X05_15495 [Bacteroidetes bacterium GWE2_41_25]OFY58027.1 MAG: hypothetical protein A2X04_05335 [Bacteroidetes bacterium GWF2_41_9]HAM11581.1 hypothetical protein [Bacteroidales bacterium]
MESGKIKLSALFLFGFCLAEVQAQTVEDIDGNIYKTVTIGTQIWMAENLKATKFNDGTEIPLAKADANEWADHTVAASTTPAYCWLYDSASVYKDRYGAFYNGFTVIKDNLCPDGWHVPSDQDWTILITYLGGEVDAGGKLKETGTANWNEPNNGATNETGFTARAGGSISDNGSNWYNKSYAFWWSSTVDNEKYLWTRNINFNGSNIIRSYAEMQAGNSVRCIKDATVEIGGMKTIAQNDEKPLTAIEQKQSEHVTIRNEAFRFEITAPKSWSFSKIVQQDPYEEMKSGKYSSSVSTGEEDKVPENWNGFRLNSIGSSIDSSPFLIIYAHKVEDQKPEDFAKIFELSLTRFGIKDLKLNRNFSVGDATGFDCIYDLGIRVRYTALYKNGIRVVIHYYFPSNDPTLFERYATEVDKVIRSLRIK